MTKKEYFWNLCQNLILKLDEVRFPNILFYLKNENHIFEYNTENGRLWCSYNNTWEVFQNEYSLTYDEIQMFIKDEVEEHFKLKEVTPQMSARFI